MNSIKYKHKPHLKDFHYHGCFRYFVTICTNSKKTIFLKNNNLVKKIAEILHQTGDKQFFDVWVYCFMPDHIHMLIEGKNVHSDLNKFIKDFKQKTSYWYLHKVSNKGNKLWQPGYYEHVLREEEDTTQVIKYILNNPVRKGLVENYIDYSHSGSFLINIEEILF